MLGAGNELILKAAIQHIEKGTVSGNFYNQIRILFRGFLRFTERVCRNQCKLKLESAEIKKGPDERREFTHAFVSFKNRRMNPKVEQRAVRIPLMLQLCHRFNGRGDPGHIGAGRRRRIISRGFPGAASVRGSAD